METFGFLFFVVDVILGIGLGISGRCHQVLGANTKSIFDSSFHWKLGYNKSLQRVWLTF